ncbi:MAG: hypothetical protein DRJ67_10930 [Thermoprotei archaeon]|nr:MAG: hypothetical protein DRJ67_10930 [Thermoprotei archaeon]
MREVRSVEAWWLWREEDWARLERELREEMEREGVSGSVGAGMLLRKLVRGFVPHYAYSQSFTSFLMDREPGKRKLLYRGDLLEVEVEQGANGYYDIVFFSVKARGTWEYAGCVIIDTEDHSMEDL